MATRCWVSYAGNDEEAWKCMGLARSGLRVYTRRKWAVIMSDVVSMEIRQVMEQDVDIIRTLKSQGDKIPFQTLAKDYFMQSEKFKGCVFLDPNCMMVKNSDFLFHEEGVHLATNRKGEVLFEAIITTRDVYRGGNGLTTLTCCLDLDITSVHPVPVTREGITIICFVNGHPTENDNQPSGETATRLVSLFRSLCPEVADQPIKANSDKRDEYLKDSIAIVGMGCRYPGANNLDEFWDLLSKGLDGIRKVPDDRWTKDNSIIAMDNTRNTEAGFLSCPIDAFDTKFFNINGADANYMDPQQRLALRVVWEALEHACIDPLSLRGSLTGVFGGWWREDYKEMLQMVNFQAADFLRGYMGNGLGPLTARISHFYELIGPAYSTESGCSTSIAGVTMGCSALRNEECNLAICVGINLLLHPFSLGNDSLEGVIAPDGRCKVFDQLADGFGRAEGVGVLILKRYPDAVRDGDRVWGLIRGEAIVQEGTSKSMGTPTVDVEAKAMELALCRADVKPSEIDFVEMHATGTPVGDPIEAAAVARVYSRQKRDTPLLVGSVKGNVGHTESVCGITSIQKMVLAMKNQLIPQNLNLKNMVPEIAAEFEKIPAIVPLEPQPWKMNPEKPRICAINSFGITGAQGNIIVQEPPYQLPYTNIWNSQDQRDLKICTFSGKFKDSLQRNLGKYVDFLSKEEGSNLKDIEYNMHLGRSHLQIRHFVLGKTKEEIIQKLKAEVLGCSSPSTSPRIAFLFTGQGSQYPGMGKELYEQSVVFQSHFDWCDSILKNEHGIHGLKEALWGSDASDMLKFVLYNQVGIFVLEYSLLRVWESWGIQPDVVLGHSTGEFAASVAAGIMAPEDALNLAVTRSKLISSLPAGKMLVLKTSVEMTKEYLTQTFSHDAIPLDIAAINAPNQTVVAGNPDAVDQLKVFCESKGVKTHELHTSRAFHSRMMDPMLEEYQKVMESMKFSPASKCRYVSSVFGREVHETLNAEYWIRHTREHVNFIEACKATVKSGNVSVCIEVGPQPVLSPLFLENTEEMVDDLICLPSLRRNNKDWEVMLTSLGKLYCQGVAINWTGFHQFTGGKKIDIPGYCFDETQKYWMKITEHDSAPFHPLLGSNFPNASDIIMFHNKLYLNSFGFIKDHLIEDKPVFLCAGYMEMLLAALTFATSGSRELPTQPVGIKDFEIKVPIIFDEVDGAEFQVIVSRDAEGELVGRIYTRMHLDDGTSKWVENAKAVAARIDKVEVPSLKELMERCRTPMKERLSVKYDDTRIHGFSLGRSLQNAKEGWENPDAPSEFLLRLESSESQPELNRFLVHPAITDPVLQAMGLEYWIEVLGNRNIGGKRLLVPVLVDNFTRWSNQVTPDGYFYIRRTDQGYLGFMYDNEGTLIASMSGVEYLETTMSNLLALIDAERNPYPELGEIVWTEQLGPCEKRIPREHLDSILFHDYEADILPHKCVTEEEKFVIDTMEEATGLFTLRLFSELGLHRYNEFTWPEICETIGISPTLYKYFRFLVLEMVNQGWISGMGNDTFRIAKQFPTEAAISRQLDFISDSKGRNCEDLNTAFQHFSKFADNLTSIITGKAFALPILFPRIDGEIGLAEFLHTNFVHGRKNLGILNCIGSILSQLAKKGKHVIRVLEVGAGFGVATNVLIQRIVEIGPHLFEYTYTEISSASLRKAEKLFSNVGISCKFTTLNLDEDPLEQGFIPEYYDVVIASSVIHATKDIEQSIRNIRKVLRTGGLFMITERVQPNPTLTFAFGSLDTFWNFEDKELRPWNRELDSTSWKTVLSKQNFLDFTAFEVYVGTTALLLSRSEGKEPMIPLATAKSRNNWLLLGNHDCVMTSALTDKLGSLGFSVTCATIESINSEKDVESKFDPLFEKHDLAGLILLWGIQEGLNIEQLCKPFLYICKYLVKLRLPYTLKFLLVTQGSVSTGPTDYISSFPDPSAIIGMGNVLANECQDLRYKFVDYNNTMDNRAAVDSIMSELFLHDEETAVAYRNNHRFLPRFRVIKPLQNPLTIPDTPRYQLLIPNSHMTTDLRFIPYEPQHVGNDDVEIEVRAYSLNFRDVFAVTKPAEVFENDDLLGTDICGVITAVGQNAAEEWCVGDRVIAIRRCGNALPSHTVVDYRDMFSLPKDATFIEGSTIPLAGITVLTSLVHEAQVKQDDIVLIHTASGGVGPLAVNLLLKVVKCEVVVTAGTERKRNFLRGLGVKHVFNSRDTRYGENVKVALGGRGVTVVLNSLTGPGFKEATLGLCETGARFIEISKLNIWSTEEVKSFRPDIDYRIVDVSAMETGVMRGIVKDMRDMVGDALSRGSAGLKSLPSVVFDCTEIRAALDYMEKVQHIGKVCIRMREPLTPSPYSYGVQCQFPLFNKECTYVITGGLGGIGLEVAKWMTNQGAGTIVLLGRNLPKVSVAQEIEKMRDRCKVLVQRCDVGNYDELENALISKDFPPIRGIMHCAGVIDDALLEEQTWDKYQNTFRGKVQGAWNLHLLSSKLWVDLHHFVLFSSITSTIGSPYQSNYVAANSYLDGLGAYRISLGLPSLTINWGQWAQVGMAAKIASPFYKPFSVSKGIAALEYAMRHHKTNLCAYEADLIKLKGALSTVHGLFADLEEIPSRSSVVMDSDKMWMEYDASETREGKQEVTRNFIHQILRATLKLSPTDEIEDDREFQDMGMDSLMMVEIKNSLQNGIRKRAKISISSVKDCNTVSLLSARLVDLISGKEEAPPLTREERFNVVKKDWEMFGNPVTKGTLHSNLQEIQNISTILVTGATGYIGSFLVHYLADMPQIKKIFCLVRPCPTRTVSDKFRSAMIKKNLYSENIKTKAVVLQGDVSKSGFQLLETGMFQMLCENVEAIFHLAAKVTFAERYRKTEEPNSCRVNNFRGTANILEFATTKRLKHVYHASALFLATQMDEYRNIASEDWPKVEEVNLLPDSAYLISKLISEGIASQYVKRGLPIKVFRFPYTGQDSITGRNVELHNFVMMRAFAMMYLGCIPPMTVPFNMIPVDIAARISLQVFFNPQADSGIYNICNPKTDDEGEFPKIAAEFGVKVEVMELEECKEHIRQLQDDDVWKEMDYVFSAWEGDARMFESAEAPAYMAWLRGNKSLYRSEKLEKYVSLDGIPGSFEVYRKALQTAKNDGLFDKFKIPYNIEHTYRVG